MGRPRNPPTTPDLFSMASTRSLSSSPPNLPPSSQATTTKAPSLQFALPKDLPNAIKGLEDQDLNRLLTAALAEQARRSKKSSVSHENLHKRRVEAVAVPLTLGKLNAVRAAFKAGVTLSQIARQFGVSQSDVRKALASDKSRTVSSRD
jgi:predicted DNA-binding protein (UPF0251 family)